MHKRSILRSSSLLRKKAISPLSFKHQVITSTCAATPKISSLSARTYVSERKAKRQQVHQNHLASKYQQAEEAILKGYQPVIGLEVHAQIKTNSKLFSGASTRFSVTNPNKHVSLVDAAFPGTLPVINEQCVAQAVKTGLVIDGNIQLVSQFDRKHYFYADMPQGYQITQQFKPIVRDGKLKIELADETKEIRIQRIQIEQDSGKSLHDQDPTMTLIDLNRAGVALMEIISHPDIHSSAEAEQYIKKLQFLLRYIGACDGVMAEGNLRVDINVSVHKPGTPYGTRCEVKNVASIHNMAKAINYEIKRQIDLLEEGLSVDQETRLFDAKTGKTVVMRTKENAPDYRFMPEPDLPPLVITQEFIENIRNSLPELPDTMQARLMNEYGINKLDSYTLIVSGAREFFETLAKGRNGQVCANWIVNELFGLLNKDELDITKSPVSVEQLGSIIDLIQNDTITTKIGKNVLAQMYTKKDARLAVQICDENGWKQINSVEELSVLCDEALAQASAEEVQKAAEGNVRSLGYIVSLVMKPTNGLANAKVVNEILKEKLAKRFNGKV